MEKDGSIRRIKGPRAIKEKRRAAEVRAQLADELLPKLKVAIEQLGYDSAHALTDLSAVLVGATEEAARADHPSMVELGQRKAKREGLEDRYLEVMASEAAARRRCEGMFGLFGLIPAFRREYEAVSRAASRLLETILEETRAITQLEIEVLSREFNAQVFKELERRQAESLKIVERHESHGAEITRLQEIKRECETVCAILQGKGSEEILCENRSFRVANGLYVWVMWPRVMRDGVVLNIN